MSPAKQLISKRLVLRPLVLRDFDAWSQVRIKNRDWLTKWEPLPAGDTDPAEDKSAFALRCSARDRDAQFGVGYGFGMFFDGTFVGEVNLNSIQRGPFQNCNAGYWISQEYAGRGLVPEGLVLVIQHAFEDLDLHRVEVAIVPRNSASLRVVDKIGMREEGTARRFLEINGVWEDHHRFAWTQEDWQIMGEHLRKEWLL